MEFSSDEINQILESNEFQQWENSIKRLIDYVADVMDEKVPKNEQDIISEDIIMYLFYSSLKLQDGVKK